MFTNTGVICMIQIADNSRQEGIRFVDLGNYFANEEGEKCLITTNDLAEKYAKQVSVPVYVRKT